MIQTILLVLEQNGEAIAGSSLRLCENLSRLTGQACPDVAAVFFGPYGTGALKYLGRYGVRKIYHAPGTADDYYSPEQRVKIVLELVATLGSSLILLPASRQSREAAPLLAFKLNAGLVSDCVQIRSETGKTEAVLNIYNGQYQMVCELLDNPNVIVMTDIRCGAVEPAGAAEAEVFQIASAGSVGEPAVSLLDRFSVPAEELDISEADIVVGVGRGVTDEEGLRQVEELAAVVGAPVGGTRPAVDAGLLAFAKQIGQTGRVIAPGFYLAIGISGAQQHISGVEKAKIIAINNDPRAPIFRLADLGAVGDFRKVLPVLVRKLREVEKEGRL